MDPVVDHVGTNMYAKIADRKYSETIANDCKGYYKKDKQPPLQFRLKK